MKRRAVFASAALGLLAQIPIIGTAHAQGSKKAAKPSARSEYEPFEKIAKDKGAKIFINKNAPVSTLSQKSALHLDMSMVRASIEHAIGGAKKGGQPAVAAKLQGLLSKGTAVQQVDFVHGSGAYYFPEDVEKAITDSGKANKADDAQCWVCVPVCYIVCTCLQNSDQYCRDKCRDVCHKYC